MAQTIAALKNLKALRLQTENAKPEAVVPLAKIKNLEHLNATIAYQHMADVVQSILLNSTLTLRSLHVTMSPYGPEFLQDWEKEVSADATLAGKKHSFTALKSLTLNSTPFNAMAIESFDKAIDFMGLHELTLGRLSTDTHLFLQHLSKLALQFHHRPTSIHLRRLCLDMSNDAYTRTKQSNQTDLEATCGFLSAFNTLTILQLLNYNQYVAAAGDSVRIQDILLQAILTHKNLTTLELSYNGVSYNHKVPYLSAHTVASIVDTLPHLQTFHFAPEETQINEIGKALARGKNLKSITCYPYASALHYPRPDEPGLDILKTILHAFLQANPINDEPYLWEQHFKLERVRIDYRIWDIASRFGKKGKGMPKVMVAENVREDGGVRREVRYREFMRYSQLRKHTEMNARFEWVEWVDGGMN